MSIRRPTALGAMVTCLCILSALALSCSDKKSTTPEPVVTPVHAPFADAAAEEMAVAMSGELAASQNIYNQVIADLDAIRDAWGAKLPSITSITHTPKWLTDRVEVTLDAESYAQLTLGFPPNWDSLNQSLRIDRATLHDSTRSLTLTFDARLSPQLLARLYQQLPGVRWAKMVGQPTGVIGPASVDGYIDGNSRMYLFSKPADACEKLCDNSDLWFFRVTGTQVDSVGVWSHEDPIAGLDTLAWWIDGSKVYDLALGPGTNSDFPDSDQVSPGVVTGISGDPLSSHKIVIRWAATGDDGNSGLASGYQVAVSGPGYPEDTIRFAGVRHHAGDVESLFVDNLLSDRLYRVAIRAADEQGNLSNWSSATFIRTQPPWTSFTAQNSSLGSNSINGIAIDQTDRMWCTTNGGGINRFDGKFWSVILTAAGRSVATSRAIEFDPGRQIIWCGAEQGALCGIQLTNSSHVGFSSNAMGFSGAAIIAIEVASNGDLWCSDGVNGLAHWDGNDWISFNVGNSGLINNAVWDIEAATNGDIWIATSGGLAVFNGQIWTTYSTANSGIGANLVRCLAVTGAGTVWCGHQDKFVGLSTLFSGNWQTFGHADSLPSTYANAIVVGPPFSPWAGTTLGLVRREFDWETFASQNSPLIDNTITALAFDSRNTLWIGTPKGLSRYELSSVGR